MAVDAFLYLDGIAGESTKTGQEKWIEIHSFSWGANNPSSGGAGSGHGTGKVDVSSLSLQKQLDVASPLLFKACCTGSHIKTGTMVVREATGKQEVYYQYDLKVVYVDSVSWGGASGGGKPSESLSISSQQITMTYWPQDATGKLGSKVVFGWDISKAASI